MRASPSLSQLWQPHSRLCQLCRVCEQQRSCSPGFCRKELHATEGAVEVRRARRRRLEEAATDDRVGLFTPDKKRGTADGAGCAANLAARRGTVCGEVGRVLRFPSTQHPHPVRRTYDGFAIYRSSVWACACITRARTPLDLRLSHIVLSHSTAGAPPNSSGRSP